MIDGGSALAGRCSHVWVPLFTILWNPGPGVAQEYREYRCAPDTQYECIQGRCEKVIDGFRYAESFIYNTKNNELSACLWTNCYAGMAPVVKNGAIGAFTATGKLKPAAHSGNEPVIVSLTIRADDNSHISGEKTGDFTAVWGYGNKGLTLDTGRCQTRKLP